MKTLAKDLGTIRMSRENRAQQEFRDSICKATWFWCPFEQMGVPRVQGARRDWRHSACIFQARGMGPEDRAATKSIRDYSIHKGSLGC